MRLIDADALKSVFSEWLSENSDYRTIPQIIDGAPTIDAEPVRHVKWKYQTFRTDRRVTVDGEVTCADCHAKHFRVVGTWFKHCPYCGGRLDGGTEC